MATPASTETEVFRPPSPRLGANFNRIFNDYLQHVSGTTPTIDVRELNARLDVVGKLEFDIDLDDLEQNESSWVDEVISNETIDKIKGYVSDASSVKTVLRISELGTPRKSSPRLTRAAKGLHTGQVQEFKPSPLQGMIGDDATLDQSDKAFGLPAITPTEVKTTHQSPETSDTMMQQQSIFDRTPWHPASDNTPLTSPDAIIFAQPMEATPTKKSYPITFPFFRGTATATYDYSATGVGGFTALHVHSSSANVRSNLAYASNLAINNTDGAALSGTNGFDATKTVSQIRGSANGGFVYRPAPKNLPHSVPIYTVEAVSRAVDRITPYYMSTKEEKKRVLQFKLQKIVQDDRAFEIKARAVTDHVHVFVDLSNITIGFYDCLKAHHKVPVTKRMKAPQFCFDHLAFILERGRNIQKRVVAGSLDTTYMRKWPNFMQEGHDLGYEMCIMQRVAKAVVPSNKNKRMSYLEPEWTASDAASSSEETFAGLVKQGEQGVDEVLHLKMLQSLTDFEPGTAVVATGDAAEAEFSDGFKMNVERLLKKGWNIEIIGWSKGISKAWKEAAFVEEYGDRVRVIELDPFVEEIFGAWFGAPGY